MYLISKKSLKKMYENTYYATVAVATLFSILYL